jgi:hypothetical protein
MMSSRGFLYSVFYLGETDHGIHQHHGVGHPEALVLVSNYGALSFLQHPSNLPFLTRPCICYAVYDL